MGKPGSTRVCLYTVEALVGPWLSPQEWAFLPKEPCSPGTATLLADSLSHLLGAQNMPEKVNSMNQESDVHMQIQVFLGRS